MASIIRADALQNTNTSNIISQTNATTLTLGYSGQTIAVASGATLLGGGITWTSNVVTSALTVAVNTGYFVNTSSNAITVTLPASASVGNTIILSDFYRTWATNALTLNQNSLKFQGFTSPNPVYNTAGQTVQLVYSGSTQGWIPISDDDVTDETPQTYTADFLVIAGGGAGAYDDVGGCGGGGAGGYRNSYASETSGGGGSTESDITLTGGQVYTITVGAGGTVSSPSGSQTNGNNSSIIGTGVSITSTGGGKGGGAPGRPAGSGGSGGGGSEGVQTAGSGTTNQGYAGGPGGVWPPGGGAGGGGVGALGKTWNDTNGAGGAGLASSITGSSVTRGGGGGSSSNGRANGLGGTGGGGNGGSGSPYNGSYVPSAGTANTGGGGGGAWAGNPSAVGNGGSGVVILRMLTSKYTGTTTGSPTVTTSGSDTILVYNASGSYTA